TITASSGLSKDEVDRMMKEAESHSDEDKKRREEIELRNRADQAVYGAERMLKDTGDKLGASDKQAIEQSIEGLRKAIDGQNADAIQKALDALTQAQHRAAESLYRQTQGAGAPGGASGEGQASGGDGRASSSGAGQKQGDVIDAEVVDEGKQ